MRGKGHVSGFHIEIERPLRAVLPDARVFDTAKRAWQMADIFGIDPDHARLQRVSKPEGAGHVIGPQIRRQAVLRVIGDVQRVRLVFERDGG